jgi:hypothetical protein
VIAFVVAQVVATVVGAIGFGSYPKDPRTLFKGCGWGYALLAWVWALIWYLPLDFIKFFMLRIVEKGSHDLYNVPKIDRKNDPQHQNSETKAMAEARRLHYAKVTSEKSKRDLQIRVMERSELSKQMRTATDQRDESISRSRNPSQLPNPRGV